MGQDDSQESNDSPLKIGTALGEAVSRRVVCLVLLVVLVTPMLAFEPDILGRDEMLLQSMTFMSDADAKSFFDRKYKDLFRILRLEVNGVTLKAKANDYSDYRDTEVWVYEYTHGGYTNRVDLSIREETRLTGLYDFIFIVFMVFLLSFGSWLFSSIAEKMVIEPISTMLKVVGNLSITLHSIKVDEEEEEEEAFETAFMEEAISKMKELLDAGYGTAGAEIIQNNLGLGGAGSALDTFIGGSKIYAIFGFCDIRKFTDSTEILQEDVLVFVNLVGHIVHQNCVFYGGSPNKNIGDAFLLVWKQKGKFAGLPQTAQSLFPRLPSYKDELPCNNIADGALKAMVQTIYDLEHINNQSGESVKDAIQALGFHDASHYDGPPQLSEGMADLDAHLDTVQASLLTSKGVTGGIKMGIGLHYGWAIEGAVGTKIKIDATYLSPHVNMAARLEAATKQFGVMTLLSDSFVDLLSDPVRPLVRQIDRVTVKGSKVPLSLFTFDFFYGDRMDPIGMCKFKDLPNSTNAKEYLELFSKGLQAYMDGDWTLATRMMMQCQKILPNDVPARVIISTMSRYNFVVPEDWQGYRALTEK